MPADRGAHQPRELARLVDHHAHGIGRFPVFDAARNVKRLEEVLDLLTHQRRDRAVERRGACFRLVLRARLRTHHQVAHHALSLATVGLPARRGCLGRLLSGRGSFRFPGSCPLGVYFLLHVGLVLRRCGVRTGREGFGPLRSGARVRLRHVHRRSRLVGVRNLLLAIGRVHLLLFHNVHSVTRFHIHHDLRVIRAVGAAQDHAGGLAAAARAHHHYRGPH
mmetsp:Transcript_433/g.1638  ORF Transcript_433/g.1638 Transcript_433/m.1638 type:complete len:221 (+) Transcript_433:1696-2358(+)